MGDTYSCSVRDLKTGGEITESDFLDQTTRRGREYLIYDKNDFVFLADFDELCRVVNNGIVKLARTYCKDCRNTAQASLSTKEERPSLDGGRLC